MSTTLVFNLKQSLFLIRKGLCPEDIGTVGGKVYHKFYKSSEYDEAFREWCGRKRTD